jgi:XTP/dITP diphosphohydrolase
MQQNELASTFLRLVDIMDELREKCPWDKKQTIASLRSMTIEETYELSEAILQQDWQHIKEELGDLMLHILFYARIGKEQQQFMLQDVIEHISNKLIVRHPHVYGDVNVKDADEVKRNWEKIKRFELTPDIWTIDGGHLTPTMKLKRKVVKEIYNNLYQKIYN